MINLIPEEEFTESELYDEIMVLITRLANNHGEELSDDRNKHG